MEIDRDAVKRFIKAYEDRMRETRAHPRTGEQMARSIREGAPDSYRAIRFR